MRPSNSKNCKKNNRLKINTQHSKKRTDIVEKTTTTTKTITKKTNEWKKAHREKYTRVVENTLLKRARVIKKKKIQRKEEKKNTEEPTDSHTLGDYLDCVQKTETDTHQTYEEKEIYTRKKKRRAIDRQTIRPTDKR